MWNVHCTAHNVLCQQITMTLDLVNNIPLTPRKGKFLTHYRDFDGNILPGTFEGEIGAGIRFDNQPIHLVVVACGGKLKSAFEEAVTMVKSAVLFSKNHLLIHIFTSDLKEDFRNEVGYNKGHIYSFVRILILGLTVF